MRLAPDCKGYQGVHGGVVESEKEERREEQMQVQVTCFFILKIYLRSWRRGIVGLDGFEYSSNDLERACTLQEYRLVHRRVAEDLIAHFTQHTYI